MKSKICDLLDIEFPIIQGGMAWVAEHNLAAAVSNAGGLGIIAAGNAPISAVREEIRKTKELTNKPFGVNIMLLSPYADEIAKLVVEDDYTSESYAPLADAITAGEAVLANPDATQDEVDAATEALLEVIAGLAPVEPAPTEPEPTEPTQPTPSEPVEETDPTTTKPVEETDPTTTTETDEPATGTGESMNSLIALILVAMALAVVILLRSRDALNNK